MQCGLLGRKLGHSYSPAIHAALGDYGYVLYEKEPDELADFLQRGDFTGLNVTIPYKKAVVPYCAALSDTAQLLGSVNTLLRRPDGTLYGDNTDYDGFESLVRQSGVEAAGKKALVLGSGGASVTAQAVLRALGAAVVVISRSGEDNYENLSRHADAAIVVNTTPVGMTGGAEANDLAFEEDAIAQAEIVFDVVAIPAETPLIVSGRAQGKRVITGLEVIAIQALEQFVLYTGVRPTPEQFKAAVAFARS